MTLPNHKIETIKEFQESTGHFLKAKSRSIKITYDDNSEAEVVMDYAEKKCMDVVCVIPYFKNNRGICVHLISCIRPIIEFRDYIKDQRDEENINMWELPAGIIEKEETGMVGVKNAASRELKEELGIYVQPKYFQYLGRIFTSGGILAERVYFVTTEADPKYQEHPETDGTPLEQGSTYIYEPINTILTRTRDSFIVDAKTIVGLYKLQDYLNGKY